MGSRFDTADSEFLRVLWCFKVTSKNVFQDDFWTVGVDVDVKRNLKNMYLWGDLGGWHLVRGADLEQGMILRMWDRSNDIWRWNMWQSWNYYDNSFTYHLFIVIHFQETIELDQLLWPLVRKTIGREDINIVIRLKLWWKSIQLLWSRHA